MPGSGDRSRVVATRMSRRVASGAATGEGATRAGISWVFRTPEPLDSLSGTSTRMSFASSAPLIANLRIPTPGGFVPLSDFATATRGEGPSEIQRFDRQRTVVVVASRAGRPLGDIVNDFEAAVHGRGAPLPA